MAEIHMDSLREGRSRTGRDPGGARADMLPAARVRRRHWRHRDAGHARAAGRPAPLGRVRCRPGSSAMLPGPGLDVLDGVRADNEAPGSCSWPACWSFSPDCPPPYRCDRRREH